jgi:ComF family protein
MRCRGVEYRFDSAYPLFRYSGDARALILAYKSGARRSLAPFFARILAAALRERYPGRVVVPVPPRPGKLRRKGWDQVDDIARILERRHGVLVRRILERTAGAEQKALDLRGRAANLQGRIRVRRGAVIPEDPILLDDVLTTGATLSECASTLKSAGALRVDALAIGAD